MNAMEASWVGLVEFANQLDPDPDPDPALADLSDAQVEREVRDGASRIAAMQCQWLLHVAELVVRGAWADQGARTPGQWLSWACAEALCDALATAVAAGPPDRSGADDHLVVLHVGVEDLVAAAGTAVPNDGSDAAEVLREQPTGDAAEAPSARSRGGPASTRVRRHVATGRNRGMMLPPVRRGPVDV